MSSTTKKKPAASSTAPKSILGKIVYAIRAQPPTTNPNGISRITITKYLQSELDVDTKRLAVKNAFKQGVEKGKLVQTGQSFRVAGDPIPEAPEEEKLTIEEIKVGTGPSAQSGDTVVMKYEGKLDDGTIFDSSHKFEFLLGAGEVIKGWDQGIPGMKVGGKRKLFIPSKLGYGKRGSGPEIPPNADLHIVVKLREIKN